MSGRSLAPCPRCGRTDGLVVRHETNSCGWRDVFVECSPCSYWGPQVTAPMHGGDADAEKRAMAEWNARHRAVRHT